MYSARHLFLDPFSITFHLMTVQRLTPLPWPTRFSTLHWQPRSHNKQLEKQLMHNTCHHPLLTALWWGATVSAVSEKALMHSTCHHPLLTALWWGATVSVVSEKVSSVMAMFLTPWVMLFTPWVPLVVCLFFCLAAADLKSCVLLYSLARPTLHRPANQARLWNRLNSRFVWYTDWAGG